MESRGLFFEKLDRFHTTPTTQGGFLRFASRPWKDTGPRQFPPRLSMIEGIAALREITTSPGHIFTSDSMQYVDLPPRLLRGHKQWTDVYLMQLAKKQGVAFATLDAHMNSLDDPLHPVLYVLK